MPYDGLMSHSGQRREVKVVGRPRRNRAKNKSQRRARKRAR